MDITVTYTEMGPALTELRNEKADNEGGSWRGVGRVLWRGTYRVREGLITGRRGVQQKHVADVPLTARSPDCSSVGRLQVNARPLYR